MSDVAISDLKEGDCSRCRKPIKDFEPAKDGFTTGYYDVTVEGWKRFARPGEKQVCDSCMCATRSFQAIYGVIPQ